MVSAGKKIISKIKSFLSIRDIKGFSKPLSLTTTVFLSLFRTLLPERSKQHKCIIIIAKIIEFKEPIESHWERTCIMYGSAADRNLIWLMVLPLIYYDAV